MPFIGLLLLYTVSQKKKKKIHLTFDHKVGKCRPIDKLLSLANFQRNYLCRPWSYTLL